MPIVPSFSRNSFLAKFVYEEIFANELGLQSYYDSWLWPRNTMFYMRRTDINFYPVSTIPMVYTLWEQESSQIKKLKQY